MFSFSNKIGGGISACWGGEETLMQIAAVCCGGEAKINEGQGQ